jgi:hypothetical protein
MSDSCQQPFLLAAAGYGYSYRHQRSIIENDAWNKLPHNLKVHRCIIIWFLNSVILKKMACREGATKHFYKATRVRDMSLYDMHYIDSCVLVSLL